MSSSKVFKNSIYYLVASTLPSAVAIFIVPVYTFFLSPQDYGVLALTQAFGTLLPIFFSLSIHSSIGRYYFEFQGEELKSYISSITVLMFVTSCLMLLITNIYLDSILSIIFPKTPHEYYFLFRVTLIVVFCRVFSSVFTIIIRVREQANLFMRLSLSLFLINMSVALIEIVVLRRGLYGMVEATLIGSILEALFYLYPIRKLYGWKFNPKMLIAPIKYSIPTIPHALSGYIFMYSDRIILEKYIALSLIGLYAISDKIAMVFKNIVNKFNDAFGPHFMKIAITDKHQAIQDAKILATRLITLVSVAVAFFSIFSVEIMHVFLNPRYFDAWVMIPILASSYIFRSLYCFSTIGLFFAGKTGKVALITIIAGIVNIVMNICLIPYFGIMVAVYSTVVAFALTYIMSLIISRNIYPVAIESVRLFIPIIYMYSTIIISYFINLGFDPLTGYLPAYIYGIKIIIMMIGWKLCYPYLPLNYIKIPYLFLKSKWECRKF